jgi:modulator of FtsH protease HflC
VKKHIGIVIIGLVIVFILVLSSLTYTVRWKEKALVLNFGKISRVEEEPGLKWCLPWQNVVKFDGRIRNYQIVANEVQTRDKQTVIVMVYVNWRIDNARRFYEGFRQSNVSTSEDIIAKAGDFLRGLVTESTNVFAEYDLGELVTLDRDKFKLAAVEKGPNSDGEGGMLKRIREKAYAGDGYGIEIVDLGIRQLGVPDSVTESVFNRMREERDAVVRTLQADGQSQADSIVGQAKGQATRIKAEAEAKARAIEGQGDAEAAQYYSAFLENPTLANFLRRLETLRKTLSERTTLILDSETPPYNLLTEGPDVTGKKPQGEPVAK